MDILPGTGNSGPTEFIAANGGFYFTAYLPAIGRELWFSDGTPAGTHLVCDIAPGPSDSAPYSLRVVDGQLLFVATTQQYGTELYNLPDVGPYVHDLGSTHSPIVLSASLPQLGAPLQISCEGVKPGAVSLLAASAPVTAPSVLFTSPGNANWLDINTVSLLQFFFTSSWVTNVDIPLDPSLVGVQFTLQNFVLQGGSFPRRPATPCTWCLGTKQRSPVLGDSDEPKSVNGAAQLRGRPRAIRHP